MSSLKPIGNSRVGKVLSFLYEQIVGLRNRQFDRKPPAPLPFPVISIGGISAGGTGKTPLTASIIEYCFAQGKTPILFSRGYGRKSKETVIIQPSDGGISWEDVGDEPAMLRKRYPQLWLAIDGNRMRAAKSILKILPSNAIGIMDDGFQHRKMARSVDIVTLPANVGSDFMIPSGLLREPLESLQRADIIVFTGIPDKTTLSVLENLKITAEFGTSSTCFGSLINTATCEHKEFITSDVTLISGIARPERFYQTAEPHFSSIKKHLIFPDHYVYSASDIALLENEPNSLFCTTEKDAVRLTTKNSAKLNNLWYISIIQRFDDPQFNDRFYELITRRLEPKW